MFNRCGTPTIPSPQIALTTLHAPPESHASHDSRNFHGMRAFPSSKIQHNTHNIVPYNNISPTRMYRSSSTTFTPRCTLAPVVPQVIPTPLKGRKRYHHAAASHRVIAGTIGISPTSCRLVFVPSGRLFRTSKANQKVRREGYRSSNVSLQLNVKIC